MTARLEISPDLSLPLDLVTEPLAVVAGRGKGKTYTAGVMNEELLKAGQQTVVLDPNDAWWGLRTSADGKGDGFPVVIFGGEHADVDLTPAMGLELAEFLIAEDVPAIIVTDWEEGKDLVQFMVPFLKRLLFKNRDPLHIFVDEAETFAPERPAKYEMAMLGAMGRLMKKGRGHGLGGTLVTQRTASLNKNVLALAQGLFVMALANPWDRKPVEAWMATHGSEERQAQLKAELAALPVGEGFFWHPEWDIFKRIRVRAKETFDSSATPKPGERRMVPKTWSKIDKEALGRRLHAAVERRLERDPDELLGRIKALEADRDRLTRELGEATGLVTVREEVEVPVPFVPEEVSLALKAMREAEPVIGHALVDITLLVDKAKDALRPLERLMFAAEHAVEHGGYGKEPDAAPPPPVAAPREPRRAEPAPVPPGALVHASLVEMYGPSSELPPVQRKILEALAFWEWGGVEAPTRRQAAWAAGYSNVNSKGFVNAIGALRTAGLVDYPEPGRVTRTEVSGKGTADRADARGFATSVILRITGVRQEMLRFIHAAPRPVSREEIAVATGYTNLNSKGFVNALGWLSGMGFVAYPAPGMVKAAEILL